MSLTVEVLLAFIDGFMVLGFAVIARRLLLMLLLRTPRGIRTIRAAVN